MPRRLLLVVILALLCSTALAPGCGSDDEKKGSDETPANQSENRFASGKFGAPGKARNRWLPLEPGTQTVRVGRLNRGNRQLEHRVVTTVTDVTKEIDGVRALIVLDQDIDAGQVAEQALDYLAEDRKGNVWWVGGYTEAYEGGQFVNAADAWLAGVDGGEPGILMQAKPRLGRTYVQAKVPGDDPEVAEVVKTRQRICVPFKCYRNVVIVQEGGDSGEWKYFAPGVGGIKTEPRYEGGEQEIEDLLNFTQLTPRALEELSAEALKLDRHARTEAEDVFGNSSPAKRSP